MYYVTRQSYWHEEGAHAVELCEAPSFDYVSPGMLAGDMTGEGEYDDPREAARAAVDLAGELGWPVLLVSGPALQVVYPSIDDADDPADVLAWAEHRYSELPKCERCEGLGAVQWTNYKSGDQVLACGEYCADELLAPYCETDGC